ncbi:MFS transporter [Intestinibacter sp.]
MKNINFDEETIYKNRWIIQFVLIVVPFMGSLDASIVNVVLPSIKKDLCINLSLSSLIISSYIVTVATTIIIFGKLGDLKGKGRVFLYGIIVFIFGSFLCSISPNIIILILSRIIQGLGASIVMANNQGLTAIVFPPNERGRALGMSGSAVALGSILGPALGGFITTYLTWHFIFLINIPIGIISFIVGYRTLPARNSTSDVKLDKSGASIFFVSIFILFSSLLFSQDLGFSNIYIILGFAIGFVLLFVFIRFENKLEEPMLNTNLFKIKSLSFNLVCAFIYYFISSTINLIIPFYLTDILNYPQAEISTIILVNPLIMFFIAPLSGYLSDKIGPKKVTLTGIVIIICSMFLIIQFNESTTKIFLLSSLAIFGLASGTFNSPNTTLVMSTVPSEHLGITGSINSLIRNLGMASGTSISTSILYHQMSKLAGYKVEDIVNDSFVYGMKSVFIILLILSIIAFIVSNIDRKISNY